MQLSPPPVISIGTTFHIRDLESNERESYTLTRPSEADIRQNRISTLTPLGKALYGRRPGETVEIEAPGGVFRVKIDSVHPAPDIPEVRDG